MTSCDLAAGGPHAMPRIYLGSWPTPLEPAPRLAEAIGLNPGDLWVKRDDLSGLGAGGNKIRKLQWLVAAAPAAGADTLVTTGVPQSDHARLTAAAAARLGLDSVRVFSGKPGKSTSGNLSLDGLFGARSAWTGDGSHNGPAQLERTVNDPHAAVAAVLADMPAGPSTRTRCASATTRSAPGKAPSPPQPLTR